MLGRPLDLLTVLRRTAFVLILAFAMFVPGLVVRRFASQREFPIADRAFAVLRWILSATLVFSAIYTFSLSASSGDYRGSAYATFIFATALWICPPTISSGIRRNVTYAAIAGCVLIFFLFQNPLDLIPLLLNVLLLDFFSQHWDKENWGKTAP
jgi:hypothetical protein